MKGAALALLCAVSIVHAEINENGCPINPALEVLKPHPDCNKYYQCIQGKLLERQCASTLVFNVNTQACDWPENVDCENRVPAGPASSEEDSKPDNGAGNNDPSLAPEICAAEGSDGVLVAHESCNKFYECSNGVPVAQKCAFPLLFNPSIRQCDWVGNVNCGDRNPDGGNSGGDGDNGDGGNGNGDNGESGSNESGNDNGDGGNGNGGNGDNGNGGNDNPSEANKICAAEGSDGVLIAHENCNQFYKCSEGKPVALNCPPNLLYDPAKEQCDWPQNVNCAGRNPDSDNGGNGDGGNGNGDNSNVDNGNGEDGNGDSGSGGNTDPSQATDICAAKGSDGILVAHENCNQFYKCSEGKPVALDCPPKLLYNPTNEQCDWPQNVNCAGRNPGNVNRGSGGKSKSNRASDICAADGSDGILISHDNCHQFYKCSEGNPVALDCPVNLLYNPANQQCDWPENVNCADRTPDSGNGAEDSGNGDNQDGGNSGNSDPSQAAVICAAEDSEGVLVAHENCNQFYTCNGGKPVALSCWGDLLYNPANQQCDWADNVNCGSRNVFSSLNKHLRQARRM